MPKVGNFPVNRISQLLNGYSFNNFYYLIVHECIYVHISVALLGSEIHLCWCHMHCYLSLFFWCGLTLTKANVYRPALLMGGMLSFSPPAALYTWFYNENIVHCVVNYILCNIFNCVSKLMCHWLQFNVGIPWVNLAIDSLVQINKKICIPKVECWIFKGTFPNYIHTLIY